MDIYEELFNAPLSDEEDIRETEEDRLARENEEENTKNERRRIGWHSLVYYLSDGDVVKFERVLQINAHLALTHKLFESGTMLRMSTCPFIGVFCLIQASSTNSAEIV